jgi:nucleotide-binding universal stress UspA family protein
VRPGAWEGYTGLYKRILLASDGLSEDLVAWREGALIARTFAARAHLLVIDRESPAQRVADGLYGCPNPREDLKARADRMKAASLRLHPAVEAARRVDRARPVAEEHAQMSLCGGRGRSDA